MRALIRSSPRRASPGCLAFGSWSTKRIPCVLVLPSRLESPRPLLAATDPPGCAHADAIGGVIGTTRQRLGGIRIEVVRDPGGIRLGGKGMQGVFRKAELASAAPQRRLCGPVCRNEG